MEDGELMALGSVCALAFSLARLLPLFACLLSFFILASLIAKSLRNLASEGSSLSSIDCCWCTASVDRQRERFEGTERVLGVLLT